MFPFLGHSKLGDQSMHRYTVVRNRRSTRISARVQTCHDQQSVHVMAGELSMSHRNICKTSPIGFVIHRAFTKINSQNHRDTKPENSRRLIHRALTRIHSENHRDMKPENCRCLIHRALTRIHSENHQDMKPENCCCSIHRALIIINSDDFRVSCPEDSRS